MYQSLVKYARAEDAKKSQIILLVIVRTMTVVVLTGQYVRLVAEVVVAVGAEVPDTIV